MRKACLTKSFLFEEMVVANITVIALCAAITVWTWMADKIPMPVPIMILMTGLFYAFGRRLIFGRKPAPEPITEPEKQGT